MGRCGPHFCNVFVRFLQFYRNLWGRRSGAILTISHHSLQKALRDLFVFCTKNGQNSPAFAPRKDWEDSEHGDSFLFFVGKDWRGLSFVFQNKEWKEWGGFSSAPSKDAEGSSTTGALGGFSSFPSREKSGGGCHAPSLPSFQSKMGALGGLSAPFLS